MNPDLGRSDSHDTPSEADLDATDRFLSSIATSTVPFDDTEHDPVTELLRAASGPAGAGELVGADRFVASMSPEEARPYRSAASPAVLVGRAVAAKAAVIAAVTVLGIAGAGAATGVILHVANDPRPQPVVTVDDPDATSPDADADVELGDTTRDAGSRGAEVDPVRTRTCAAATDGPGLERLARAATAASSTATDYCRGTGTLADPDRPDAGARDDSSSAADDAAATRGRGTDPEAPPASPGPPAGNGGAANGGAANGNNNGGGGGSSNSGGGDNNGVATPGTPNTKANPNAGNGGNNGSGTPNNATPGTPNNNANPRAGAGASDGGANSSANGPTLGGRAVGSATSGVQGGGVAPDASTGSVQAGRSSTAAGTPTPRGSATHPERGR